MIDGHRRAQRRLAGCVALLIMAVLGSVARAAEPHSAAAIKAAYLVRFAGYVRWPDASEVGHAFLIDVVGASDIARELRRLLPGRLINNEPVEVREVTRVQETAGAQMLYVAAGHVDFLRAVILSDGGKRSLLIVSDDEQGLDLGSVLNFVTVDDRVRFEISLTAADRFLLKISADLLSVAIRVRGGRRQSDEACIPFALLSQNDARCGVGQARRLARRPGAVHWARLLVGP